MQLDGLERLDSLANSSKTIWEASSLQTPLSNENLNIPD
jgi:hypothetical protein